MSLPPFDFPALVGAAYEESAARPFADHASLGLMQGFPPARAARVDKRNFMGAPLNRWSFQHIGQLLPSIAVPASKHVRELPRQDAGLAGFEFTSISGRRVTLAQHLAASHTDGFVVLKDGRVAFEHYANGQTPDTRHIMFSVTKSLIGTMAERLVVEGRLDDRLRTDAIIPELAGSAFGDATVRQLMDMAVGIHYREDYEDPLSESSQFGWASGLVAPRAGEMTTPPPEYAGLDDLYAYLPRLKKRGEHGGFFDYCTAVTEVVAWVIERHTGVACHEMLAALWEGIGAERDGFFIADPSGRNVCGAGFNATLRDMARFGQMLLDFGRVGDAQVLPRAVVESLLAGADPAIFAANPEFAPIGPFSYKSQWYVLNGHVLLAIGVHGQQLYVDFDARMVTAKQSSQPAAVSPINADTGALMQALGRALR
jgi:CubicO group peptidase (beta-lactamase class C family)